jgi:hypothetical protein
LFWIYDNFLNCKVNLCSKRETGVETFIFSFIIIATCVCVCVCVCVWFDSWSCSNNGMYHTDVFKHTLTLSWF